MDYKNYNDYELAYMISENEDSFDILYNKYQGLLKKIVYKFYSKYKKYGVEYDDLKQEADIAFYKMLSQYKDGNLLYTFFSISINNRLLNYIRIFLSKKNLTNQNAISLFEPIGEDNFYIDVLNNDNSINPSVMLDEIAFRNKLYYFKYDLNFKQSCVYELFLNGFSRNEIANLLDLKCNYVSNILYRIRKEVQKCLN